MKMFMRARCGQCTSIIGRMMTKLCLSHSASDNAKYDIFTPKNAKKNRGAQTLPRPQCQVRFASKISEVSQG